MFDLAKQLCFDEKALGNKCIREESIQSLLKSPAIMPSVISTVILPETPNEVCDRIKLLIQENQVGNNANIIDEGIFTRTDKLIEYKCVYTKHHKFLIIKCLN